MPEAERLGVPSDASHAVELFPMAIGCYAETGLPDLEAEAQAGRLLDLLAGFGARNRPWAAHQTDRGAGAVERRLRQWSEAGEAARAAHGSILYWVGHGWSDGNRAALAHSDSPVRVGESGVTPEHLADAIRSRQAAAMLRAEDGHAHGWAMVVIDACRSRRFVERLVSVLKAHDPPQRVLLVGVSGDGATTLGRFTDAMYLALTTTYRADGHIPLTDLVAQFHRLLPGSEICTLGDMTDAVLVASSPPVASWMSAPLDDIRHLEEIVDELSPDERRHFFVKAQGAEHGEMSWFFEGREQQRAQIAGWLRLTPSGMLVVVGRAGSGKSALLGNVLVHSIPDLRDALGRRGLITVDDQRGTPPANVFNAVIHLSGLSLHQAAARVAAAAELGRLPSQIRHEAGIATDLDWLCKRLDDREEPFTLLADALDEATDPMDIARSLLSRIAAVPLVRVVVGTRASINETPDAPGADINLLHALASGSRQTGADSANLMGSAVPDSTRISQVWLKRDAEAIRRYVAHRLRAARDNGSPGFPAPNRGVTEKWRDADIDRVSDLISQRDREFLYARLAVYEILEEPRLLTQSRSWSLEALLDGDHKHLFEKALERLAHLDDRHPVLLQALSLAHGRGLPEADGIWATISAAIASQSAHSPRSGTGSTHVETTETEWADAICELLGRAAAYVIADTLESSSPGKNTKSDGRTAGRTNTVFRLAHRTFVEYFASRSTAGLAHDRRRAAYALLQAATEVTDTDRGDMPSYIAHHLSEHAAEATLWNELAEHPRVLDRLDPGAVTADALRTLFGHQEVPPSVAGIIGAHELLAKADPSDRPGLRQLAMAINSSRRLIDEVTEEWGVAAAQAGRVIVHARLGGHTASVNRVRCIPLFDRLAVLVSASDDGTIRLWDADKATPIGSPLFGHTSTVEDLSPFRSPDGRVWVASAGGDRTVRIWDPASGRQLGEPLAGHNGRVWAVCALPGWNRRGVPDGRTLLATGDDGSVRIWDPVAGHQIGNPLTGHDGGIWGICTLPGWSDDGSPDNRTFLATAGQDGSVRIWDPLAGHQIGNPLTGHDGGVRGLFAIAGWDERGSSNGSTFLATAGDDGSVRIWDPLAGHQIGNPLTGHDGRVWGICTLPGWSDDGSPDNRTFLATAGQDGSVRIWDPLAGHQIGTPLTGHDGRVLGVCAVAGQHLEGRALLATAGWDGSVRIWDPVASRRLDDPLTGRVSRVRDVCTLPGWDHGGLPDERTLLATGQDDGSVRIWDPLVGHQLGTTLCGHTGSVLGVCLFVSSRRGDDDGGRTLLATTGRDGSVRIWDPVAGHQLGTSLTGHDGRVWGICTLPGWSDDGAPDGRTLLATTGQDGTVRIWDPITARQLGNPLTGHVGGVWGVCALPSWEEEGLSLGRTLLASAGEDGSIRVWDPVTARQIGVPLTGHTGAVFRVRALPGSEATGHLPGHPLLVTAGEDGTVWIWDPVAQRSIGEPCSGSSITVNALSPRPSPGVECTAITSNGSTRTWDSATATLDPVPVAFGASAAVALVVADDGVLLVGDRDGLARQTGGSGRRLLRRPVSLGDGPVLALCRLPGSRPSIAGAGRAGTITILDLSHGTRRVLQGPVVPIRSLCPVTHPGSEPPILAAGGNDGVIRTWDVISGEPYGDPLFGHDGWIWSLTVLHGPEGSVPKLASSGADRTIRIWDPFAGCQVGPTLTGHTDQVRAITSVISADGRVLLVSGSHDGTVRLWNAETSAPVRSIPLGIPIHSLLQQRSDRRSLERTSGGATLTAGVRTGIISLDLHSSLFPLSRNH